MQNEWKIGIDNQIFTKQKHCIFSWKIIKKNYENSDYVKPPGISKFEQEGDMQMTALVSWQLDKFYSKLPPAEA